jgi:hypothetical protein
MGAKRFHLNARISSATPSAIRPPLDAFLGPSCAVRRTDDGFQVEADIEGENARDLNRALLSELRRAVKRTRLRAEWTADGVTERFFDYVPKGSRPEGTGTPNGKPLA